MTAEFEEAFTEQVSEPSEERGVTLADFVAYMPQHVYIFMPCCEFWPAGSVNSRLPPVPVLDAGGRPKVDRKGRQVVVRASDWLDRNAPVEQATWCPGEPRLIDGRLVVDGGWIFRAGVTCFNLYRPPKIVPGDPSKAGPWLDHVRRIYPDDAGHIVAWLGHRVQKPEQKVNHGLVLGGLQGIGKDSMLEPVKHAVGPWNFKDISPTHMLGSFNSYAKAVILRVSEARDLGEVDRFSFYDHTKIYTAAPPDVLRVNEKHIREHYVFNCLGFLITTNHKSDGIYLPADDRRHYVAWSSLTKDDFESEYWNRLWGWYADGGIRHVAAYLGELDISGFDPKAPPPKTEAFWAIVAASQAPEDAGLADVIDALGSPDVTTLAALTVKAKGETLDWLMDRRNRRAMPHRMERCGYVPVRNPYAASDGLWKINGARQVVYARATLSPQDQMRAAQKLR
jgi:hypothetical protein